MAKRRAAGLLVVAMLLMAGCADQQARPPAFQPTQAASPSLTAPLPKAATASPTLAAKTSTPAPSETAAPPFTLCSPLEGISLAELGQPDLLKNPYQTPHPGMDDGHHGDDFAFWSRGEYKTMLGLPVHAALGGRVAAVIANREPYGNAIMIETPLQALPQAWLDAIPIPSPAPTLHPAPNLMCPADPVNYQNRPGRSLYLLYAHLEQTPNLATSEAVACGQTIGAVGTTGKSVNPHLHLETRVGPSGAAFKSMSHYDTSSSDAEMAAYCTWRVSGLFQMFDPMQLLK